MLAIKSHQKLLRLFIEGFNSFPIWRLPHFIDRKEGALLKNINSVKSIHYYLVKHNYTTAYGYDITHKDVLKGVQVMRAKHSKCEWILYLDKYPKILADGFLWLQNVYFSKGKSLIDADIAFFEQLVENYKSVCDAENVNYIIPLFINDDMTYDDIAAFVNRKRSTVKKAFYKLPTDQKNNSYYYKNKKYIASDVCDNLCKKYFKQSYLHYLENLYVSLKNNLLEEGIEVIYE